VDYEIGFAGIPAEYQSEVQKQGGNIVGPGSSFWLKPFAETQYLYSKKYNDLFRRRFASLLRGDLHHALKDTAFIVVYIDYGDETTSAFVESAFPAFLTVPVQWAPVWGDDQLRRAALNELTRLLAGAAAVGKAAAEEMRKEVVERANRTPFLLPLKNFDSGHLKPTMQSLQASLGLGVKPDATIRQHRTRFELQHAPVLDYSRTPARFYFEDARKVRFRAPGNDLHGQLRPYVEGHPDSCVLGGLRRLGAPFHHSFHYDCTRVSQAVLKGTFFGCHEAPSQETGKPHLNIAPNDFVR